MKQICCKYWPLSVKVHHFDTKDCHYMEPLYKSIQDGAMTGKLVKYASKP